MNVKDYLAEYRALEYHARKCAELADDAMHSQLHSPSFGPRVKSSGTYSLDNIAQKIEAAEGRFNRALKKLLSRLDELTDMICQLEDCNEKTVLVYRYIYGMPWKQIVRKMPECERTIMHIHGRALKHLQNILDQKEGKNGTDHTDDT